MANSRHSYCALLAATLAGLPGVSRADDLVEVAGLHALVTGPIEVAEPPHEPGAGRGAVTFRTIHAVGFRPAISSTTYTYSAHTGHTFRLGGSVWFDADLSDLPEGAELTGIELEACDTNPTYAVIARLFSSASPTGPTVSPVAVSTGTTATPGCAFFGGTPAPGMFIDNFNNTYTVRVGLGATDESTSLGAIRIMYRPPALAVDPFLAK
jgi:hypothetical protein